ncbi:hypothetical protein [Roseateles sp.]|uniref:hypothetical protein n=1 Tax=Roseateles sp. TaxID=1971397 RepID=UPI002F413DD2
MTDLKGTVWSATRDGRTTYVRVTDNGPTHAHVMECDNLGRAIYTLGKGWTTRQVQLSHEGTRVKGRKRVEVQA